MGKESCARKQKPHTIVNLDDGGRRPNHKLEPHVPRTDGRGEGDRVVLEGAGAKVAGVDRVHGGVVQHDAHEAVAAVVEVGAEREAVRAAHGEGRQVLVQAGGVQGGGRVDGARLVELVREGGVVAGGGEGVFGVDGVCGDPGAEAAFEAAVGDEVVRGSGRARRGWG